MVTQVCVCRCACALFTLQSIKILKKKITNVTHLICGLPNPRSRLNLTILGQPFNPPSLLFLQISVSFKYKRN